MLPIYILLTALTAQFFYILVNWYFFKRREYFFYTVYVIIITVYFLNRYLADENGMIHIDNFTFSKLYPDKALAVLSYIFYFKFGRHFIEAKTRYPFINRLMSKAEIILFIYILVDIVILAVSGYSTFENNLFLPVNISIFLVLIFVFRAMILKNEMLDRFILTGSMFYGISAFITMWMGLNKPPLYDDHFLALQIGALVEMIFLNAGLVYKSRMLQKQTLHSQEQLIEKYEENQELQTRIGSIRERISRDLHDDVGASLSSIKAYSEILETNPSTAPIAELIKNNSTEMIERLEVIAWAANPSYDNFKSLKNMMMKFAVPLCHSKKIDFNITCTAVDDQLAIHSETRQHIFMIFKESVNNMIKYADASNCSTDISISENRFECKIADNGKGFDETSIDDGNGLINMRKRAAELGGELLIESKLQKGTAISVRLPFPFIIPVSWDSKSA